MVDWSLAATVGKAVSGMGGPDSPAPTEPFTRLAEPAAESERLVERYTMLAPAAPLPEPEALDRSQWVDATLRNMRSMMSPLTSQLDQATAVPGALNGALKAVGGVILGAQVGLITGVLAQRVLGQYDIALLEAEPTTPPRLYFIAPNLAEATRQMQAEPEAMLRWVALHETTHAVQFGAVAWLKPHLAGLLRELLSTAKLGTPKLETLLKLPNRDDLNALIEAVRSGDLPGLVLGPERRGTLDEVQAIMSVIEGYAEHVMDAVGEQLIPEIPAMREAMAARRSSQSGLFKVVARLIGLEMKMRQYEQGKKFCDAVVAHGGIATLNRVWMSAEHMPTLAELDDPLAWIVRTEPAPLPTAETA